MKSVYKGATDLRQHVYKTTIEFQFIKHLDALHCPHTQFLITYSYLFSTLRLSSVSVYIQDTYSFEYHFNQQWNRQIIYWFPLLFFLTIAKIRKNNINKHWKAICKAKGEATLLHESRKNSGQF